MVRWWWSGLLHTWRYYTNLSHAIQTTQPHKRTSLLLIFMFGGERWKAKWGINALCQIGRKFPKARATVLFFASKGFPGPQSAEIKSHWETKPKWQYTHANKHKCNTINKKAQLYKMNSAPEKCNHFKLNRHTYQSICNFPVCTTLILL